jgi:hypothetical protein
MSTTLQGRLRAAGALAALACLALAPATSAQAAGGTSAACVKHYTPTFSPGLRLTPSSGIQTTHGETGTIDCVGTIAGHEVTGRGSAGYEMPYTAATCAAESSSGTVSITIPTTAGREHFVGALSVRRTALAFTVDARFPGMRLSAVGVAIPLQGTCVLTPLTEVSLVITGSLTDA